MSFKADLIKRLMLEQDDPYHIGEESDSDDERGKSSDEEVDIEINNRDDKLENGDSESEDDFEKEMQMDLDAFVLKNAADETKASTSFPSDTPSSSSSTKENNKESKTNEPSKPDCYDDDYFSSGSEDENLVGGLASKSPGRRKLMTDEELFYDPNMDDEDEKWVLNQREQNRKKVSQRKRQAGLQTGIPSEPNQNDNQATPSKLLKDKTTKVSKPPTSDAILSCPACMTTVCIDCQRHQIYKNQYRAMFVMNCTVVEDEVLKYQEQRHFGKRKKGKNKGKLVFQEPGVTTGELSGTDNGSYEAYHPVKCTECGTEVAVYDTDEVYHFFNILTSYA